MKVGVSHDKTQPIPDVDCILGNDLAGGIEYPSLIICESTLPENPTADLEQIQPGLFPSFALTRPQARTGKFQCPPYLLGV